MTEPDAGGGASRSTDPASGSSAATDVSLREFIHEMRNGDRRTNRDRFVFLGAMGAVIWFFIERHLADLNHENARVAKVSEGSVSSDTYAANEKQRDDEREKLDAVMKDVGDKLTRTATRDELTQSTKTEKRASIDTGTKVIAAVFAALVLALAILNYQALHSEPVVVTPTVTTTTP